ncbi:transposase [Paenibacillus ferrarius]|uniref:transposase n=1 Tax=Paenibacillus ferrarius TaxID=1469647 RepID=UPI003D2B1985
MHRRNRIYDELRIQVVKEVLAGIKVAVLARKYEVSPKSINSWVREYRDQIDAKDLPTADAHVAELKRLQALEEKYEKAMKVLGDLGRLHNKGVKPLSPHTSVNSLCMNGQSGVF